MTVAVLSARGAQGLAVQASTHCEQWRDGEQGRLLAAAVSPGADFLFVNIGHWRSAEDFMAATQSPGFRESAAGLAGYRPHPGLYRVVRT